MNPLGSFGQPVRLRRAVAKDIVAVTSLVNRAYRPGNGPAGWTHEDSHVQGPRLTEPQAEVEIHHPQGHLLIAEQGTVLLGCIQVIRRGDVAWLGLLAVDPAYQGQGLGRWLMAEAEAWAGEDGARTAALWVLEARHELWVYYNRQGYFPTGAVQAYPHAAGVGIPRRDDARLVALAKVLVA